MAPSTIGQSTPLIDGRAKVTGTLRFVSDLTIPGMAHARLVTSPYPHARITHIDSQAALAIPGVIAVLTAADMPAIAPSSRLELLLARDRVIFSGQPVALVLAASQAAAHDGSEQVLVDYEPLPAATTIERAIADGAPLVWPQGVPKGSGDAGAHGADSDSGSSSTSTASNIVEETTHERGDIAAGFAAADVVLERTFDTSMVHQSSLETHGMIVQPDPVTGGATIWTSTQAPFMVREQVAKLLGVVESDVRVNATPVGGGFGGKFPIYEPLVAFAAQVVQRPVRLILTRMEELQATNPAPAIRIRLRIGAKRDGTLTAIQAESHLDNGCYPFWLAGLVNSLLGSYYPTPNYHLKAIDVLTFKPSVGAYRAPAAPTVTFAIDTLMDELAEKLGLDPLELRLKSAAQAGDTTVSGNTWPAIGMRATLEALREHSVWQNRARAREAGRGVGIAVGGWGGGVEPAAAACGLNRDGLLHVHVGSVDLTGTTTGFTLLAAEAFGIAPDKVRIITGNTESAPYSGATGGSKVTYTTGSAVVQAARSARQQVLEIAAEEFEAAAEDIEIVGGMVQVRGVPEKAVTLGEIAAQTMQFGGRYAPVFAHGRNAITKTSPGFSAQLAEVSVDRETGAVKLHQLIVAQDVGKAINPLIVRGQMTGGATQGIGWALYEKMDYGENGQLLNGSWMEYVVPRSDQTAPETETIIVEVPSEIGPFGARGIGEPPVIPTAAAIANAIADATGVRLSRLPMAAPDVLAALGSGD